MTGGILTSAAVIYEPADTYRGGGGGVGGGRTIGRGVKGRHHKHDSCTSCASTDCRYYTR